MLDWLFGPIDPSRAHEVGVHLSWHARTMVIAWGVLAPMGVIAARFFKVLPWQNWPQELDNRAWWNSHRLAQYSAMALALVGLWLIRSNPDPILSLTPSAFLHRVLGYAMLALALLQAVSGWLRGTKGGPMDTRLRGDHYDMTPRRLLFERVHKTNGYLALSLAALSILTGLWQANAPRWMWLGIMLWWVALIALVVYLQRKRRPVTTYEAIWGPDPTHPGNRLG